MPDAAGIDKFNYDPPIEHSKEAAEETEAKEASAKDVEATLVV
jgi:hypothetical protein